MTLFTLHLDSNGACIDVSYRSIRDCIEDTSLARVLDTSQAEVTLWVGNLRITGKPIQNATQLRDTLIANANTIWRHYKLR
jgi:hypothetical protein